MESNSKIRGFIRVTRRHSEKMQRAALAAAGCGAIYVFGKDTAADLVRDLRAGDFVIVTTLARLAPRRELLNGVIDAILDKKSTIVETTTGRKSKPEGVLRAMLVDAFAEYSSDMKALTTKQAKEFGAKGGTNKGINAAAARTPEAIARAAWHGNNHLSNREVLALPDMAGWSESRAYSNFKPRNRQNGVRVGRPRKTRS
jgi:DNA invertase Pin-like site-specific DNA recombinase